MQENINGLDSTMTDENRRKFDGNFYMTAINEIDIYELDRRESMII